MAVAENLPQNIRRPLRQGAIGISAFLGVFVLWAIFAPLATTITINGSISSSQPSLTLQHTYGGLVSEVLVGPHEKVSFDQPLMRFDVSLEEDTLAAQSSINQRLQSENHAISEILKHLEKPQDLTVETRRSPHFARFQQVRLQQQAAAQSAESLKGQLGALQQKVQHGEAQLALMVGRSGRIHALGDQGLTRRSDEEALQEQILIVKGEIKADQASAHNLRDQLAQSQQNGELAIIALRHELTSIRQGNLLRLDELQSSILDLTDRINKSVVRSPIDGLVSDLPIKAEHALANRGATLMTLAQPLEQARVAFTVPVEYIDQIEPGMSARLSIPSLPQREMPKITLTIDAISPRARRDETGNPTGYDGLAYAEIEAFETLRKASGSHVLSEDMPVLLLVSARETTFGRYLLSPLLSAFSKALQD